MRTSRVIWRALTSLTTIACVIVIYNNVWRLRTRQQERREAGGGKLHQGYLHVIIQFPVLSAHDSRMRDRQAEYMDTLEKNLLHELVREVHILCESSREVSFINNLQFPNTHKLVLAVNKRRMRYSDAFRYASTRLIGKTSIIINADCYIGQGFEKLGTWPRSQRIVYALTRHETADNIRACKTKDFCGPNSTYIGSHDAFVLLPIRPLSATFLDAIDYRPDIAGAENVVIRALRKDGFVVRNPCKILFIYHNHCSKARNKKGRLVQGMRLERYLNVTKGIARFSGL
ncbi:uncharacterized protein LOC5515775 isoform X2 [Nematostella vectensis]|uniref:uncharacterized protein LOC5515775 isoform X2 n=1 Tax=Nematostella vectensis TaxID=45351 RepID=UPI0020778192|nr:uncharacterized protein LOC5515775 isoform X2 [Nematostella vectensis]